MQQLSRFPQDKKEPKDDIVTEVKVYVSQGT